MCAPQNIRAGQPVLAIEETGKRLSWCSVLVMSLCGPLINLR
jgi:hypothetical protein